MNDNKKQDISPVENEATLRAADLGQEEDEEDRPKEPKKASDYLDLIMADTQKLSGIIDAIGAMDDNQPVTHNVSFHDLAWAMHDFTDRIDDQVEDLWDHLKEIGTLMTPKPENQDGG